MAIALGGAPGVWYSPTESTRRTAFWSESVMAMAGPSKSADNLGPPQLATAEESPSPDGSANWLRWRGRSFEAPWVAGVNSTADRLEGELKRVPDKRQPDYQVAADAIAYARHLAERPNLLVDDRLRLRGLRRLWRRVGSWWAGADVYQAWSAIHIASEALLGLESTERLRSQLGDMAASLVTTLTPDDLRISHYLETLDVLSDPRHKISEEDRAQLREIRHACNSSMDSAHADARAYRNTLVLAGLLIAAVLVTVAVISLFDAGLRSVFASGSVGRWYVVELELVASLAGLTGAVLSLKSYIGFQYTYGLPSVQAFLKGTTGAATGLFGVIFVQAGIISFVKSDSNGSLFAVAIIFGYAQYLFTRLVDQQANKVLTSASSHNDPGTVAKLPATSVSTLLTMRKSSDPQAPPPPEPQPAAP